MDDDREIERTDGRSDEPHAVQQYGNGEAHRGARAASADGDPDVYLDVPTLKVGEVDLEVEDLRARVALRAEVLDLLKLNVGVDVVLGKVRLDITDVEAKALLKVRLDNVADIVAAVLRTIEHHPEIVEHATRPLESAADSLEGGVSEAAGQLAGSAGDAAKEVTSGAKDVAEATGDTAKEVADGAGDTAKEVTDAAGDTAAKGAADAGESVDAVDDQAKHRSNGSHGPTRPRANPHRTASARRHSPRP